MEENKTLIKVLVGSRAHGLHTESSDYDFRGIYITSTKSILSLNYTYKGSHWFEGEEDQTIYELQHFLQLALKCNPSILEIFMAPEVIETNTDHGIEREVFLHGYSDYFFQLKELFPAVWNSMDAFNAFIGYGLNQRKKMLDNHLNRWPKYAVAYVRTLLNLIDLLETGKFSLIVSEEFKPLLMKIKNMEISKGSIVDIAENLKKKAEKILLTSKHESNPEQVNQYLLYMRKKYWN